MVRESIHRSVEDWMMMLGRRVRCCAAVVLLCLASGWGCGGAQQAGDDGAVVVREPAVVVRAEPARFVLVLPTTRLYREADVSGDFLQLRSVEQEAAERSAREKSDVARRERDAKTDKAWAERERARVVRERKRARTKKQRSAVNAAARERRDAQRGRQAAREIGYVRADAREYRFDGPAKRAVVLRWIADHGDWVEVETTSVADAGRHCYGQGYEDLGLFRMRFFVRREALLPMVRERVLVALDRGTSVALLPGVLLERVEGKKPHYRALVDGFEIPVGLGDQAVGETYRPVKLFEMQTTASVFSDEALVNKRLQLARGVHLAFNPYYPLYVLETHRMRQTVYTKVQTPCAEYVVKVREADLVGAPPNSMRFDLREKHGVASKPYVKAGSRVFAPDGAVVGEAFVDAHLGAPIRDVGIERVSVQEREERMCFQKIFGERWEGGDEGERRVFTLCVQADDVVMHDLKVF